MLQKKFLLIAFGCLAALAFVSPAHASTNISSNVYRHWAWNDAIGWIDFYNTNTVNIISSKLQGYASSSVGPIALDCSTAPVSNCSIHYGVSNDGAGNLSGWAWNDNIGWISFCGSACGVSSIAYRVTIDSSGNFRGYAWNDLVGWISFNCSDPGICGTSQYMVSTSWAASAATGTVDSTVFDTGVSGGAQLNSIMWQGNLPATTDVSFQIAVSNSPSGPWTYTGYDGTSATNWEGGNPGVPVPLNLYSTYANFRYFRYRVILTTNVSQTVSPRVDDVIVNWSP